MYLQALLTGVLYKLVVILLRKRYNVSVNIFLR